MSPRIANATRTGVRYPGRLPGVRVMPTEETAVRDAAAHDGVKPAELQRLLYSHGLLYRRDHPAVWSRLIGFVNATHRRIPLTADLPAVRVLTDVEDAVRAAWEPDGAINLAVEQRLLLRGGLHVRAQDRTRWVCVVARRDPDL